jgi:hypothetical protein
MRPFREIEGRGSPSGCTLHRQGIAFRWRQIAEINALKHRLEAEQPLDRTPVGIRCEHHRKGIVMADGVSQGICEGISVQYPPQTPRNVDIEYTGSGKHL